MGKAGLEWRLTARLVLMTWKCIFCCEVERTRLPEVLVLETRSRCNRLKGEGILEKWDQQERVWAMTSEEFSAALSGCSSWCRGTSDPWEQAVTHGWLWSPLWFLSHHGFSLSLSLLPCDTICYLVKKPDATTTLSEFPSHQNCEPNKPFLYVISKNGYLL